MPVIYRFPNIRRAALKIARDSGRACTERQFMMSLDPILGADGVYESDLREVDEFLGRLSDQEMDDLCCGDEEEKYAVLALAGGRELGERTDGLLDMISEHGGC